MFDVTKCAVQEAIIDLGVAFNSFFEKRGRYPRFKKKGVSDSFCAANEAGAFRADGATDPAAGRRLGADARSGPLQRQAQTGDCQPRGRSLVCQHPD